MTTDYCDLITRMAKELDDYRQLLLDDRTVTHRLSNEARAVLARWGNAAPLPPADGEAAELVAWLQEEADDYDCIGCEDSAAKCKRAAELLGEVSGEHSCTGRTLEEAVNKIGRTLEEVVNKIAALLPAHAALAEADEPAAPLPLADTHYEWELEDAEGEWQAGGSSNSQSDVEREGRHYLQTYAQDGPHKLIIRQHTTQTINEITNDH